MILPGLDQEDQEKEFEAILSEMTITEDWVAKRPSRQTRKTNEKKAQQSIAERSRRSVKGETRSSAINIRTTPAMKAKLDKSSKAAKQTSTQFVEEAIDLKSILDAVAHQHGTDAHALLNEMIATLKSKKG